MCGLASLLTALDDVPEGSYVVLEALVPEGCSLDPHAGVGASGGLYVAFFAESGDLTRHGRWACADQFAEVPEAVVGVGDQFGHEE